LNFIYIYIYTYTRARACVFFSKGKRNLFKEKQGKIQPMKNWAQCL